LGEAARAGAAQLGRLLQTGLGRLGAAAAPGGGGGPPPPLPPQRGWDAHASDGDDAARGGGLMHPSDYDAVVVFVVGGISSAEVRELRQELEQHRYGRVRPALVVGGTALVGPADVVRHVFS